MYFAPVVAVLSAAFATAASTPSASAASSSPSVYKTISNRITACPGKFDKEEELLLAFVEKVKEKEPGVLEFQLNSARANSSFLTYEKYASAEAIAIHLNSTYYKELIANEIKDETKCAANQVFFLDGIYQFTRRS